MLACGRVVIAGKTLRYKRFLEDFPAYPVTNVWGDTAGSPGKIYVVQTSPLVVGRCMLMTTDPGDLVFDPTAVQELRRLSLNNGDGVGSLVTLPVWHCRLLVSAY